MTAVSDPRVKGERGGQTHRQEGPEIVTNTTQQACDKRPLEKWVPAE